LLNGTEYFQQGEINKKLNAVQKDITAKKKAKEDAAELIAQKTALDKDKAEQQKVANDAEAALRAKVSGIGNLLHKDVPVSNDEVSRFGVHCQIISWFTQNADDRFSFPMPSCS
jgi:seryl-tRNA synthetase